MSERKDPASRLITKFVFAAARETDRGGRPGSPLPVQTAMIRVGGSLLHFTTCACRSSAKLCL